MSNDEDDSDDEENDENDSDDQENDEEDSVDLEIDEDGSNGIDEDEFEDDDWRLLQGIDLESFMGRIDIQRQASINQDDSDTDEGQPEVTFSWEILAITKKYLEF